MSDYEKLLEEHKALKKEYSETKKFFNYKNMSLYELAEKRRKEIEDLKEDKKKLERKVMELSLLLDAKIRGDSE